MMLLDNLWGELQRDQWPRRTARSFGRRAVVELIRGMRRGRQLPEPVWMLLVLSLESMPTPPAVKALEAGKARIKIICGVFIVEVQLL